MEFKNVEKLEAELTKRLKADCFNIQGYLNKVETQVLWNQSHDLELSQFETKSGHTELISFDYVQKFFLNGKEYKSEDLPVDEDGDVDFDYVEIEVTF